MINHADEQRIATAIEAAEKKTAGEIMVVVAGSASGYHLVPIVWAAFLALLLPALLLALFSMTARRLYEVELIVFGVLAFVLSFGRYRYHLVPHRMKRHRAHEAAREQFLARGTARTRGHTGVLLYVALAERYAELVPDSSVSAALGDKVWKPTIEHLVARMREGRVADGIVETVESCGATLAPSFPPGPSPQDELPNKVIVI